MYAESRHRVAYKLTVFTTLRYTEVHIIGIVRIDGQMKLMYGLVACMRLCFPIGDGCTMYFPRLAAIGRTQQFAFSILSEEQCKTDILILRMNGISA